MGIQTTELVKKRQFTIVDGKIRHMFDTNETIGDEMLRAVLGEHSDEYMKTSLPPSKKSKTTSSGTRNMTAVGQGVAGSGKTSAILQRIAFCFTTATANFLQTKLFYFRRTCCFHIIFQKFCQALANATCGRSRLLNFSVADSRD